MDGHLSTLPIADLLLTCRARSLALAAPLSEADMQIQAAIFASPSKWHLAHTTWFFDEFVLKPLGLQVQGFTGFAFLFNSYYETVGKRQSQAGRGLMSRPSLSEIMAYRSAVDETLDSLLSNSPSKQTLALVTLGIQHEQQHQELFLTDILYNLSYNPLHPAYDAKFQTITNTRAHKNTQIIEFDGGLVSVGFDDDGFCYDNETPTHQVFLQPFGLANTLVTNAQWIAFIEDGGYDNPLLWLSDGWHAKQKNNWQMPLYWEKTDDGLFAFGLNGLHKVDPNSPVSHISFFEADAYARWAEMRLPTEFEWEYALTSDTNHDLQQCFDTLWQWTASPYIAYPGFRITDGAVGEYNGKFMNGQYVLRGSSFATAPNHTRATYRNFFYPDQRWQFSGLRLATL